MKRVIAALAIIWFAVPFLVPNAWKTGVPSGWLIMHPATWIHSQTTACANNMRNDVVGIAGYQRSFAEERRAEARRCLEIGSRIPHINPDQANGHRYEAAWLMVAEGEFEAARDQFLALAADPYWITGRDGALRHDMAWLGASYAQNDLQDQAALYQFGQRVLAHFESEAYARSQTDARVAAIIADGMFDDVTESERVDHALQELRLDYATRLNGVRFRAAFTAIDAGELVVARAILDRVRASVFSSADWMIKRDRTLAWLEMEIAIADVEHERAGAAYDRWMALGGAGTDASAFVTAFHVSESMQMSALNWLPRCDELDAWLASLVEIATRPDGDGENAVWRYSLARTRCDVANLRGDAEAALQSCSARDELRSAAEAELESQAWMMPAADAPEQRVLSCFANEPT